MPALDYFAYGAALMKVNAPHLTDWSIIARLRRIGIEPGKFARSALNPAAREALQRAARDGPRFRPGCPRWRGSRMAGR
jgi:hypothetical protein